jgi:hypothetical protein
VLAPRTQEQIRIFKLWEDEGSRVIEVDLVEAGVRDNVLI